MIRFLDEFRNKKAARSLAAEIRRLMPAREINLMEICGGHTLTALKYGLAGLLPEKLSLKSGPGCPVCVTAQDYIDTAVELTRMPDVIVASFGDMLRVPGSETSLLAQKSRGKDVRICLSPLDAVKIAAENPKRQVVFLGIGFETTAPVVGSAICVASEKNIANFSVLAAFKTMPAAMRALLDSRAVRLDGFICPGHVTAITGTAMYEPIAEAYRIPCVVSGFEPTDMLESVKMILEMIARGKPAVINQYSRIVRVEGNPKAREVMREVFSVCDASWRGLGTIPGSGLAISAAYAAFDAVVRFPVRLSETRQNPACICGDVMRGVKSPRQCRLFGRLCTPENPVGACMVSAEGACGIYYRYSSFT